MEEDSNSNSNSIMEEADKAVEAVMEEDSNFIIEEADMAVEDEGVVEGVAAGVVKEGVGVGVMADVATWIIPMTFWKR
jgi:hypothetical protein